MILAAILIAVAIPVFNSQLNKAKEAADSANARALYGQLMADYMLAEDPSTLSMPAAPSANNTTSYKGTDYKWSSILTAGSITAPGSGTAPVVTITTNGKSYTFGSAS